MSQPVDNIFPTEHATPVDKEGFIAEDPDGKYLLLGVDDFNSVKHPKPHSGPGMSSYLRLGAAALNAGQMPSAPSPTGEDLAALVQGFADDFRNHGNEPVNRAATSTVLPPIQTGLNPSTLGDGEVLVAQGPDGINLRSLETSHLHQRGGWRDHSDGNRITTTRGDKVEIIRGNYKMLVLGRQDDPAHAAGWDVSGGLVDTADLAAMTQAAHTGTNLYNVDYTWAHDSDGNWGWTQTTMTGSPAVGPFTGAGGPDREPPGMSRPAAGAKPPGNGKQIGFTWVDEIQSFTGGPNPNAPGFPRPGAAPARPASNGADGNTRVNRIYNRSWMNVLDEAVDATTSISEQITSGGTITSTTTSGGDMDENYSIDGAHHIHETSHSHTEVTLNTQYRSEIKAALGMVAEIDMAILMVAEIKAGLLIPEVKVGGHLDLHLGAHLDNHIGLHSELHMGIHTQLRTVSAKSDEVEIKTGDYAMYAKAFIGMGSGPPSPPPPAAAGADTAAAVASSPSAGGTALSGGTAAAGTAAGTGDAAASGGAAAPAASGAAAPLAPDGYTGPPSWETFPK